MQGKHRQPVEQVWPKTATRDFLFEIPIGSGDHPDIDAMSAIRADALNFTLLQDSQQFRLDAHRQFPDFIQKESAAIRNLELSGPIARGPGERARNMAEQFALRDRFRNGGAVDLNEGFIGPGGRRMNMVRHEFLADPGFARNQHSQIRACDDRDLLAKTHGFCARSENLTAAGFHDIAHDFTGDPPSMLGPLLQCLNQ